MADARRIDPVAPEQQYDSVPLPVSHDDPRVITTPLPDEGWLRRNESLVIGTVAVIVFMVAWQLVANARIWSALFLPGPADIVTAFAELIQGGELAIDIAISSQEFATGYAMAAIIAIPLGLLLGWYPRARYALDPFVTFLYATPRIVLLPLFIIWFGIGIESKIAVIFLGAFFAILINTTAGVRNLDTHLIRVARSLGGNDLQIFRTIALPGSVPFILTGLRLGLGHALIGVVVGEYVAAQHGIGKMMMIAGQTFQSAQVFAGLTIIATAGLLMTLLLQRLERHFDAWRPQR
ncbi:MAG TPA: ABC transporter permease [Candidatus Limnocylindria bacterium]|nr:ABC transporter permease [Candidatus Limnocylindria bacterium]